MRNETSGLIIDSFAGGGGASTGIEWALNRSPDVAINHDDYALAMHAANHPGTLHLAHDVWEVNMLDVTQGRPVELLWASPDCKHFSKAKGGKPVSKDIRSLAWVVVQWAKAVKPKRIFLENVEEFETWGPLVDGRPCPVRGGETFKEWVNAFKQMGYAIEWRVRVAANAGAPTTRKRLFIIARCDGKPIIWTKPRRHKPKTLAAEQGQPQWRTAADIIDWSIPCPSIFDTSEEIFAKHGIRAVRPLAENTMRRIARGLDRYVLNCADPFIVPVTHQGDSRCHGIDEPLRTVTTAPRGEHALITPYVAKFRGDSSGNSVNEPLGTVTANSYIKKPGGAAPLAVVTPYLADVGGRKSQSPETRPDQPFHTVTTKADTVLVAPTLIQTGYGERPGQAPRVPGLDKPLGTCVDGGKHAVVAAFLAQNNTGMVGHDAREPLSTVVGKGCTQSVVSAGLINLKGSDRRQSSVQDPVPTQCAGGWHIAEVRAFLMKYHRDGGQFAACDEPMHTIDCKGRMGLVEVMIGGEPYAIVDIGMRMLTPRELFRAQGFPEDYIIEHGIAVRDMPDIGAVKGDKIALNKTQQIKMCGNSVSPYEAWDLVQANCPDLIVGEARAMA